MPVAVLADIHSNLEALEAVLGDLEGKGGGEDIWCLGDMVGYGPDPHACIKLLRERGALAIAGNHDWAAIGQMDLAAFNPAAAAAARWTTQNLTPEDVQYLRGLPTSLVRDDFTLVHGSPREPLWEYLLTPEEGRASFSFFSTRYCLVGHSHIPLVFPEEGGPLALPPVLKVGTKRLIINPGAVGQPRDGDPRASYLLYRPEEGALYNYRVPYDIPSTQQKMQERGLPFSLAARLSSGH